MQGKRTRKNALRKSAGASLSRKGRGAGRKRRTEKNRKRRGGRWPGAAMQAAGQRDNLRHRRDDGNRRGERYGLMFNLVLRRRGEDSDFRQRVAAVLMRLVGGNAEVTRAGYRMRARCIEVLRAGVGARHRQTNVRAAGVERVREQRADDEQRDPQRDMPLISLRFPLRNSHRSSILNFPDYSKQLYTKSSGHSRALVR